MQVHTKSIGKISWADIKPFNIFVAVIRGSDGIPNHAVGIFNGQIFDVKKKIGIPFCKEGIYYCDSTSEKKFIFESFAQVFSFENVVMMIN